MYSTFSVLIFSSIILVLEIPQTRCILSNESICLDFFEIEFVTNLFSTIKAGMFFEL